MDLPGYIEKIAQDINMAKHIFQSLRKTESVTRDSSWTMTKTKQGETETQYVETITTGTGRQNHQQVRTKSSTSPTPISSSSSPSSSSSSPLAPGGRKDQDDYMAEVAEEAREEDLFVVIDEAPQEMQKEEENQPKEIIKMLRKTRITTRKAATAKAILENDAESEKKLMGIASSMLDNLAKKRTVKPAEDCCLADKES